jgi:hypothetical protein
MIGQIIPYLLVAFCLLVLVAGQIIFKIVGIRLTSLTDQSTDWAALGLLAVVVGLYGVSTLAWIVGLRTLPLIKTYIYFSVNRTISPVSSNLPGWKWP